MFKIRFPNSKNLPGPIVCAIEYNDYNYRYIQGKYKLRKIFKLIFLFFAIKTSKLYFELVKAVKTINYSEYPGMSFEVHSQMTDPTFSEKALQKKFFIGFQKNDCPE